MEAEEVVCRGLLARPEIIDDVDLSTDEFTSAMLSELWRTALRLRGDDKPITPASIVSESGGKVTATWLASLLAGPSPTIVEARWAAKAIRERARSKRLEYVLQDSLIRLRANGEDIAGKIDAIESDVFDACANYAPDTFRELALDIPKIIEDIRKRAEGKGAGVPFGLRSLDEKTGGMMPGDLIAVGARTGHGKTAFAAEIIRRSSVPVLVFSLEMSRAELGERKIAREAQVDTVNLRKARLSVEEWARVSASYATVADQSSLYVDDRPMLTLAEVASASRRAVKKKGVGLIIVDYLQLVRASDAFMPMEREIATIAVGLKQLARSLSVPIIALGQLNREPTKRNPPSPRIEDFRGSDAIAHESNIVLLLWRPELHSGKRIGELEIVIGKHRTGPTGRAILKFTGEFVGIDDMEEEHVGDWQSDRED